MRFRELAEAYEKIEETSGRLDMMGLLAEIFAKAESREIGPIIYLTQGVLAPPFEGVEVGMGAKLAMQAIAVATGYDLKAVEKNAKKSGDVGDTAEELISERRQRSLHSEELAVLKVFESFHRIARISGHGAQEKKIGGLVELLNSSDPLEARYIVRFVIGALRLGAGDSTIMEALSIAKTGGRAEKESLERAYNLCSDLGLVAKTLYEDGPEGIRRFGIRLFHPVRPALAERLSSAEEIIGKLGTCAADAKYDGFRMQVHKRGNEVEIYSRRLEKMTPMYPEIVAGIRAQVRARDAILEGEALAYNEDSGEFYPFQTTIQRKRKHGVAEKAAEFPLKLFAFDLLYADGRELIREKYSERRKALESLVREGDRIRVSDSAVVSTAAGLQKFFDDCISRGLEGIIAKDLNAEYVAGARKFAWIKLKRSYKGELADTIDVVIVGYLLGRGARTEFGFGGFLGAVYDEDEDRFKTITKVGTGFTEEQMKGLKRALDRIRLKEKPNNLDSEIVPDVWVAPKYVVTLAADEITRSPKHTAGRGKDGESGYALRFPRLKGDIRADKGPKDATTVREIAGMFARQGRRALGA
ncbi:MAG: ATP-dependent DNA ligase [Candidatus ainarchaeum sp.]|nr:ATP-dependent DNA ligase [Candidatus ainarchaeum sp.]